MDYLSSEVIAARGWQDKRIGVEMDNYYFSAAAFASLQKHLPQARFVDTNGLVNWQRAVKSDRRSPTCGSPRASSRRCTTRSSR